MKVLLGIALGVVFVQGDHDLLTDAAANAGAVFARAHPPKRLLVVHGGSHLGFADVGAELGDDFICALFPDPTTLAAQIAGLAQTLGGAAHHLSVDGCPVPDCGSVPGRIDGRRQQQIGKAAALAFFEAVLRGDGAGRRYLDTLAARNPDVTLRVAR